MGGINPEEAIIIEIDLLAQKLNTFKRSVTENAIREYSQKVEENHKIEIFEDTFGAWQRSETPAKTVKQVRDIFRKSMERNKQRSRL
ncbi:MAG: hypothetical protein C0403_12185 [Desulfobacterium sp.]|nr:hypothetical protein [Desulfobacterium sp.]